MHLKLNLNDQPLMRGFKDFNSSNKIAVRNTLNTAAALTRRNAITNIKSNFITRNTFTEKSIMFDKADQSEINQMQSVVGALSRAYYLEQQELGGVRHHGARGEKTGKTAIGMKPARAGSLAKAVLREKYLKSIRKKVIKKVFKKSGTHKSYAVAAMYMGKKLNKYIKRGNNIFIVKSFEKSGRNNVRARLELLYTIHEKQIHIKKRKWLEPATRKPAADIGAIYRSQLKKQWKTAPEKL